MSIIITIHAILNVQPIMTWFFSRPTICCMIIVQGKMSVRLWSDFHNSQSLTSHANNGAIIIIIIEKRSYSEKLQFLNTTGIA